MGGKAQMKILITGSSGFIGSALRSFLENKGIEIVNCDIKNDPSEDVRNYFSLRPKIEKVDGIIHLAAVSRVKFSEENPNLCIETNIEGTLNILRAVREVKKSERPWIILGSSREVYGNTEGFSVNESSPKSPINIYGISKLAAEELCRIYSKNYGLKVRVLRFSNVYTDRNDQLDRVVPSFIQKALRGEVLVINGKGEETLDFIYISDIVEGIWASIQEIEKSQEPYNDFNLCTGRITSLRELAEIIIEVTKSKSEIRCISSSPFEVVKFSGSSTKAKDYLGFVPRVSLREGIKMAIGEFK
jgi:nucleoside-diphosphate-sugar epimerase